MKKHIIITILLLIAVAFITVVYFKNLNPPEMRTSRVMRNIPGNASLIFEFSNDQPFYDIFKDNQLLKAVIGKQKVEELDTLRRQLLLNPLLEQYFSGQNIFVSIHPAKANDFDLLITTSALKGFEPAMLEELGKKPNSGLVVTPFSTGGKRGYTVYISILKKRFYIINKEENIFSGSFSKDLIDQSLLYKSKAAEKSFVLLSEQQNANSLANLYVNYGQLPLLFNQFFKNKNADVLKNLKLAPGPAALGLNYRSDALMFNGITGIQTKSTDGYLNLFTNQHPVANHLKDIFPSTTAYSINFAVSDAARFGSNLSQWQDNSGHKNEKSGLFNKIKAETGINIKTEFDKLLNNEFAFITTRYQEKLAIISVKDGSKLNLLLTGISAMTDENAGQLNYDKLPFYLLGDAFGILKRPYFKILDNYLILANSTGELASYYDSYINRKFLSKNDQYNGFDNLLAERSNITFFFQFKNLLPILKADLDPDSYNAFETNAPGWKDFYGASYQFTAADKNFYTNFCMKLNADTAIINKLK